MQKISRLVMLNLLLEKLQNALSIFLKFNVPFSPETVRITKLINCYCQSAYLLHLGLKYAYMNLNITLGYCLDNFCWRYSNLIWLLLPFFHYYLTLFKVLSLSQTLRYKSGVCWPCLYRQSGKELKPAPKAHLLTILAPFPTN